MILWLVYNFLVPFVKRLPVNYIRINKGILMGLRELDFKYYYETIYFQLFYY